jgi:two-component system, response regulator YesN
MLKNALIVDDNQMILEALGKIIDWDKYGYKLVGKAYNGLEALEISKRENIDILLTDIKMPEMDGLQLIREIKSAKPDIKIIILSAYNEFSLVREAFKLGASEFILKTELDPSFLGNQLVNLSKEQDDEKKERDKLKKLSEQVQKYIDHSKATDVELQQNGRFIRDRLLNELVRGYISVQELIMHKREYISLRFCEGKYAIIYLCIDNQKMLLSKTWKNDERLLSYAVLNIIDELLDKFGVGDSFEVTGGEFCILLCFNQSEKENEKEKVIINIFKELTSSLEKTLKIKISAGASIQAKQATLPILYAEANQACQLRVLYGRDTIIFNSQNIKNNIKNDLETGKRLEYLKNTLVTLNPDVIRSSAESLIVNPASVTFGDFEEIIHLYQKYSLVLFDFIEQNVLESECNDLMDKFYNYVYNMGSVTELNKWLKAVLEAISRGVSTGNSLIRQVKKYINEHFSEDLSLQNIAEAIGVSSSYLSKLIIKELGVSFTDYLNNFRIQKAKELIQHSTLKIYEIAEKVGYGSIEHFSRVFKKVTGKSPKEYSSGA